ncbi:MAG: N-acetylmuramoyl-L-alanine amidase [Oscillospiraceae bacterium]|nr:N-acetylmuramoyl-L-alanine amidase [Oscillospiraceae bacterium]
MARRRKSNSKIMLVGLAAGFLVITLIAIAAAFFLSDLELMPEQTAVSEIEEIKQDDQDEEEFFGDADDEDFEQDTEDAEDENTEKQDGEQPNAEGETAQSEFTEALDTSLPDDIMFDRPEEMRAVHLTAGVDFLAQENKDSQTVQEELDAAVAAALELQINTIVVDCFYENKALHNTASMPSAAVFDVLDMVIKTAKANDMYVYAVYDLSKQAKGSTVTDVNGIDTDSVDSVMSTLKQFVKKYDELNGIMFTGYYNPPQEGDYADYLKYGGGMGYDAYMKDASRSMITHAVRMVRSYCPNVQAGLLIDVPWANAMEHEEGSSTKAMWTALVDGNADTRRFINDGTVDFAMVQNYGSTLDGAVPFATVAKWWDSVANNAGIPVYMEHASSKICTDEAGWTSEDQLVRQVGALADCVAVQGSVFNSLSALSANTKNSTDALLAYFNDNISMDHILKDLVFTAPDAYNKTTFEKELLIKGASDPTFPLYMDGEEVERDSNGYFAIPVTLVPGDNVINFKHKDRDRTFHINRIVQIIKEVTPTGTMAVDGGMEVTVTVTAYQDAVLTASVGGQNITLTLDDTDEDEELRGTSYRKFKGVFTVPEATSSVQNLGQIKVHATWEGLSDSKTGANVTVNKKVAVGDGVLVRVTAAQAETFPINKLDDISSPSHYPLPKGTLDYAVGNEITYKDGNKTFNYYKLKSGLRVYSKDITAVSSGELYENTIKGMLVKADNRYTTVVLNTSQNVPYKVNYSGDSIQFSFQYTKKVPDNMKLSKNPLFSNASWNGSTLTLKLLKSGAFLGYTATYTNNGLEIAFNNPTQLKGSKIVVDPGHGVKDKGAAGFNPNYPESVINWEIAEKLAADLQSYGANVKLIKTRGVSVEPTMEERVAIANAFKPHVYVSVHANSGKSTAVGSEAYYFYPFAKNLSGYTASQMASALGTTNRGGKYGLYYVTRSSHYVAVLCETGFVSNRNDYNKLIETQYQKRVATGILASINTFLKGAGASNAGITGTQSVGSTTGVSTSSSSSRYEDDEDIIFTGDDTSIDLEKSKITLEEGESITLEYTLSDNDDDEVKWSSDDEDVAEVNSRGKVTAVGEGTAIITVTHKDSGEKDTCKVTVTSEDEDDEDEDEDEVEVTGIELDEEEVELEVGETIYLTETIKPSKATNTDVEWESDDEDVAEVNSRGKVTAVGEGECTITVTTDDGEFTAECVIIVTED